MLIILDENSNYNLISRFRFLQFNKTTIYSINIVLIRNELYCFLNNSKILMKSINENT